MLGWRDVEGRNDALIRTLVKEPWRGHIDNFHEILDEVVFFLAIFDIRDCLAQLGLGHGDDLVVLVVGFVIIKQLDLKVIMAFRNN
jgi:hypothetical protein